MPNTEKDDNAREELLDYFGQRKFDYKRGYIRKVMRERPEITDRFKIGAATEQMMESHDGGVELSVDDALRFVENEQPITYDDIMHFFESIGLESSDILFREVEDDKIGMKENKEAVRKARLLTKHADMLAKNPDVILLGIPVFDHEADWAQAKLAFFSERLNGMERAMLLEMRKLSDDASVSIEHGVAVVVFQILNIWDDFH